MCLVLWMLRLYPPTWRERYENEMVALLEQHEITLWTVLDLLVGALDARLDPHYRRSRQALPLRQLQTSWKLLVSALLAFLLSLLLWLNMGDAGLAPGQPCHSDPSGCAWAYAVGAHTPPLSQTIIGLGYLTFVLLFPFLLIIIGWIVVQVMKSAWNLLRFLPIALFILLLLNNWWNNIVLLIVFMVSIALVAESGGAMLISYRSWEKRHNLLLATLIRLLALLVINGMVVVCIATGVWLVDLWVVFPLFDFGLLIQLLLGFVLMVAATATALVALVRSTVTLRAVSAAHNNTSSLPQRDRTDSKGWIMVLSLGLFAFIGTIMFIFVHIGYIMFLLLSLFAGLVSMMNALAMKKNRVEIADLPNQEPL